MPNYQTSRYGGGYGDTNDPLFLEFLLTNPDVLEEYSRSQQAPGRGDTLRQLASEFATENRLQSLLGGSGGGDATAGTLFSGGSTFPGQAVGSAANGGTLLSTEATVPAFEGVPVGSAPATATGAGGAFSLSGIGSAGNAIAPLGGAIAAGDLLTHDRGKGRGFLQGAGSGAAIGSYFGPTGALVGAGIGGLAGLTKGVLSHESTRDVAKRHTRELLEKSNDPLYQSYVQGQRAQFNSGPPDPSKPFAGKYRTFDEYKRAGLIASDLSGVRGNIDTFGPEWANLTQAQREAVTQGNIEADNYHSRKGEVEISNRDKAREILNRVLGRG